MTETSEAFRLGERAYWDNVPMTGLEAIANEFNADVEEMRLGFIHASKCDDIYRSEIDYNRDQER